MIPFMMIMKIMTIVLIMTIMMTIMIMTMIIRAAFQIVSTACKVETIKGVGGFHFPNS